MRLSTRYSRARDTKLHYLLDFAYIVDTLYCMGVSTAFLLCPQKSISAIEYGTESNMKYFMLIYEYWYRLPHLYFLYYFLDYIYA